MRTRVKICGLTRPEDAVAAARLGADAVGLVFYERSPRRVSPARAAEIIAALPPFVTTVGLFVDAPESQVRTALEAVRLDMLQFHGDESPGDCAAFGLPYIKAIRVRAADDLRARAESHAGAAALLFDTYRPGVPGGTGERFDWAAVPQGIAHPVILAGGLTPENVAEAVAAVHPYAVDVSGGVEAAKGIKDAERMAAFFAAVRFADRQTESSWKVK